MPKYFYTRGTDDCDKTFDIWRNDECLVSVHYWEEEAWAESEARLIVAALNAYDPA